MYRTKYRSIEYILYKIYHIKGKGCITLTLSYNLQGFIMTT